MGLRTRNPPKPIGQRTLIVYDEVAWSNAIDAAEAWGIDLGLYVEYALRHYFRRGQDRKRFVEWRTKRDAQDPDLVEIKNFLAGEDAKDARPSSKKPKR